MMIRRPVTMTEKKTLLNRLFSFQCLPPEQCHHIVPYLDTIPPEVDKKKCIPLNVLQTMELISKLEDDSRAVAICTVLQSNTQQRTFSSNRTLLPLLQSVKSRVFSSGGGEREGG